MAVKNKPKFESFLKGALIIIAVLALTAFAVILFSKNPSIARARDAYDLAVLLIGIGALFLGVIASLDSRTQRRKTELIQNEIHLALKEIRKLDRENAQIIATINKEEKILRKLDRENEEILEAIAKEEKTIRHLDHTIDQLKK